MEPSTITNRTLDITGMNGDECVQKVTDVLKHVAGVTTQSVKVGCATVVADAAGCTAARTAIENAGYKARDRNSSSNNSNTNSANGNNASTAKNIGGTSAAASTQSAPMDTPTIPLEPKQANLRPVVSGTHAVPAAAGPVN